MSLGCGVPVDYAGIRPGDRILDLGSGAGNDCFVARSLTGANGHVTALDFTEEMLLTSIRVTGYTLLRYLQQNPL